MVITPVQVPPTAVDSGHILIEPCNLPDSLHELLTMTNACVPPFLWSAEATMPRLLELDSLSPPQRDLVTKLLEHDSSEQHPPVVCAWLQSDKGTEELTKSVASLICAQMPEGNDVIWRYYDPRVFVLIAHLFTYEQGNALLGEIERWAFPWRGRWWSVQRTTPFKSSTTDRDIGWPNSAQWDLLTKSRIFHQIHSRLQKNPISSVSFLDDLRESINAFRESASYRHLNNDETRAEFAYLSTRYREYFRNHRESILTWNLLRGQKITLHEMLATYTATDFEYMETRLRATRTSK